MKKFIKNCLFVLLIATAGGIISSAVVYYAVNQKIENLILTNQLTYVNTSDNKSAIELSPNTVLANNTIVNVIDKCKDAVVTVTVTQIETYAAKESFFDFFFNVPRVYQRKVHALGSGVIINSEGYIITNAHVVENSAEIKVTLPDNREYTAKLVGLDTAVDLAVLKVKDKDLPYSILGDSDSLRIGETVIAMGNPYGYLLDDPQPTVTTGVLSAVNRTIRMGDEGKIYHKMLQTDAAINSGNSGGPLFNSKGEVIGINTFIFSKSGGSIGLGFAIPINFVKKIAQELIKYGHLRNIWLGFDVEIIDKRIAYLLKYDNNFGIVVSAIAKNSPADKIGLKVGDVIEKINDYEISDIYDARVALAGVQIGDTIKYTIWRNGKILNLNMEAIEKNERN